MLSMILIVLYLERMIHQYRNFGDQVSAYRRFTTAQPG